MQILKIQLKKATVGGRAWENVGGLLELKKLGVRPQMWAVRLCCLWCLDLFLEWWVLSSDVEITFIFTSKLLALCLLLLPSALQLPKTSKAKKYTKSKHTKKIYNTNLIMIIDFLWEPICQVLCKAFRQLKFLTLICQLWSTRASFCLVPDYRVCASSSCLWSQQRGFPEIQRCLMNAYFVQAHEGLGSRYYPIYDCNAGSGYSSPTYAHQDLLGSNTVMVSPWSFSWGGALCTSTQAPYRCTSQLGSLV